MNIAADHPVLAVVVDAECDECSATLALLSEVASENATTGLELVPLEYWDQPEAVRDLSAMEHPTAVLYVSGRERARLTGRNTKRQFLRKYLPYLYPDPDDAVKRLREQLDSQADAFPSRRADGFAARSQRTKVELLRSVPLFGGLTGSDLHRVARFTDEVPLLAGQTVAVEGEPGDELLVILEGSVEVTRHGRRLARLEAGDHVGEMSLLDGEPRSATVRSTQEGVALVVHRRDFQYLLDTVPGIAHKLLANLSRRLRDADRRLVG